MKLKHRLLAVLAGLTIFFIGFFIGKDRTDIPPGTVTETIETTVDTIPYRAPKPQKESALGTRTYTLPDCRVLGGGYGGEPRHQGHSDSIRVDSIITAHCGVGPGLESGCSKDSAIVELPMIQRHYADSTYEAWISGPVDPRLDSLRVFVPTTVITRREWKPPKRWHIGVTAGCGLTLRGAEPFVGVGITYSIFSF